MPRLNLLLCTSLFLSGCALDQSGAQLRTVSSTPDIAMSADYRMVFKRARDDRKVFCAEPSPDIGRIVTAASSGSFAGSAKGLEKVQPEIALAFAASRAEGLAQLGQRLATIQLLRDSTFRACEAYANGAIGASTYAMIVSRYDDVMVTLLLGEMAAGASRPSPAALFGGTASTTGLTQPTADAATKLAVARMEKATTALDTAVATRAKLKADATEAEKAASQQAVAAAQKEFDESSALLKASLLAVGGTSATAVTGGGGEGQPLTPAIVVAQQLGAMQQRYLDDFNLDAVTVGCLSALSQLDWPERSRTTQDLRDAASPSAIVAYTRDAAPRPKPVPGEGVSAGSGVQGGNGATGFLSSTSGGAYSLQDECRAILLNGQTLRAAAQGRLEQLARGRGEQAPAAK